MPPYPTRPLAALTALIFVGTLYSTWASTYLDTSNPLLTHLPHPLHTTHYFASKSNILNLLFTKKLWGWSSLTFFLLYTTSPPLIQRRERLYKWLIETAVWVAFTGWFWGPSIFDRLTVSLGGECILHLPSGALVSVPEQLCYKRAMVNPQTHPDLFAASLVLPADNWSQVPRIRRGHDISGHLFLLTMSILFLSEQANLTFEHFRERTRASSVPWYHWLVMGGAVCVLALAYFAAWTTSVYFHTPAEKLSGFLLGVAGYSLTRLPFLNRRI